LLFFIMPAATVTVCIDPPAEGVVHRADGAVVGVDVHEVDRLPLLCALPSLTEESLSEEFLPKLRPPDRRPSRHIRDTTTVFDF
jgi:hypothetical protein